MTYEEAVTRYQDARLREIDARLDLLQLEAAAREDSAGVAAIHELRVRSEGVRRLLDSWSEAEPAVQQESHCAAAPAVRELEMAVGRAMQGSAAGGPGAGVNHIQTRLDRFEARSRLWRARRAREEAELDLRRCELLFALQERTALARAHDAEQKYDRYHQLAQGALAEAAHHFNEAFDAAAKRHQLSKAEP